MRGEEAIFNLEIKKKSGLSINPDIHHSKVPSSDKEDTKVLENEIPVSTPGWKGICHTGRDIRSVSTRKRTR